MYSRNQLIRETLTVSAVIVTLGLMPQLVKADPGFSFGGSVAKNEDCLKCHNNKKIVGDNKLINGKVFQHTTHAQIGCKTCHSTVPENHPGGGGKVAMTTTCADCHNDISTEYSISKHSISVPNCSGCHNPHTAHKAGEVYAMELNSTCTNCHNQIKISATHAQWLPQSDLHLGSISCVTCHTKAENFVMSVYIARRNGNISKTSPEIADYQYLKNKTNSDDIQKLVDKNLDNYISIEELKSFNRNPSNKDLYLKAILTPSKTTHAFQTSDKSLNCTFCHASGPSEAQVSKLVLPKPDGTFRQMDIEKGSDIASLNVIPDFYMMGSSRNSILNILGAAILAGGLVMPVGHGFFRFLTRKNRKKE